MKFDTLHHHHIILYFKVFGPNFLLNYFACTVSFTTKHQRTSKSNTTHFFWVKLKFKCESAYYMVQLPPTLTHLSDDAIGLILILTCPAILSLVSLSDLKSEIYTFTADWSVSMAMVQWLYTKDAKFSQVFGSSSIIWMYTCVTGQWLTVNIFYGHTTSPIWGKKDLNFAIPVRLPMFVKKILSSSSWMKLIIVHVPFFSNQTIVATAYLENFYFICDTSSSIDWALAFISIDRQWLINPSQRS